MNQIALQNPPLHITTQSDNIFASDPAVPLWTTIELPDTWPDKFNFRNPRDFLHFLALIIKPFKRKVELPDNLLGKDIIPKYILQEFHNLPNGNYSNRITRGYTRGFDISMLGKMKKIRPHIANWFSGLESVLDVGTAGGHMANALKQAGVEDVWGLDPSPYLLKHASTSFPGIKFIQGLAEKSGFPDKRFSGITACFLLHEIPPAYCRQALKEFNRILKPNGLLALCEPSAIQFSGSWSSLFFNYGLTGIYFKHLAKSVFEPFIKAWHKQNILTLLEQHGYQILKNEKSMPTHCVLARKIQDL